MMKSGALVKIGIPAAQAAGMKRLRQVRAILEQHDAAVARLDAATNQRIREATMAPADGDESDQHTAEPSAPLPFSQAPPQDPSA